MNTINKAGFYGVYKKNAGLVPTPKAKVSAQAGEKTDVVSISQEAVAMRDVGKLSSDIARAAGEPTSPERLASIQQAVKDKSYHISSEELVESILGRSQGL